ncbi:MAG TPA: GNAT family N-acetyltransferase [Solirubrobacteraceae bacterium]|nr:GNAT family N-acetyltransferase [Solirubrobacteraceae bacterium]
MPDVSIRDATRADVPGLYEMIVALAVYEREPHAVTGTTEMLAEALFGAAPVAEALIAEVGDDTGGFAIHYRTFSTWECTAGIWLEDLFVRETHRRAGIGEALLRHLAALAVQRGCARLEWAALSWNSPALDFYAKLGAERLEEWRMHRLDGAALQRVAGGRK